MRLGSVVFVLSFVAMSIAAGVAGAGTIVVTPSNMQGWVLSTVTTAHAALEDPVPPGGSGGWGGLYMALGKGGSHPDSGYSGQVWMGTNAYDGVALSSLTTLSYEAWCANNGIWESERLEWRPPRQPCTLRLVINSNKAGDPTPIRMLMFRPIKTKGGETQARGYGFSPFPEYFGYLDRWILWDTIYDGETLWAEFMYNASPCLWTGSWAQLLARYPNATITTPALQLPPGSGQWPPAYPVDTPNGCGLSLEWGGETWLSGEQPEEPYSNWWREAWDGVGFADYVQVGAGENLDIYDFEADAKNDPVATNLRSVQDKIINTSRHHWPYIVYGRAVVGTMNGAFDDDNHFYLEDGSGQQIEVVCEQHSALNVTLGNYYRVRGTILPRYAIPYYEPKPEAGYPMRIHTYAFSGEPLVTELPEPPPP